MKNDRISKNYGTKSITYRGSRVEEISEVLTSENFSKLKTENKPHIQEGQEIPN